MTTTPEPDQVTEVLARHDAKVGPITGKWICTCGVESTNGSIRDDDLTGIEDRRAQYRTHLAAALRAAGLVVEGTEVEEWGVRWADGAVVAEGARHWECVTLNHGDVAHVIPLNDVVPHTETDDCVCGPSAQAQFLVDGSNTWLYTHHSLDNREATE